MKSLRCAIGIHSWAYNYSASPMTRSCNRCSKNQYLGCASRHFPAPWMDGEPPLRAEPAGNPKFEGARFDPRKPSAPPNAAEQLHALHAVNERLRRDRAEAARHQRRIDANSPVPGDPTWPFHSAFPAGGNDYSAPQSPVPGRFEGLGGTFDGAGASADWSSQSGGSCDSSSSSSDSSSSCDSCSSSSSDSSSSCSSSSD